MEPLTSPALRAYAGAMPFCRSALNLVLVSALLAGCAPYSKVGTRSNTAAVAVTARQRDLVATQNQLRKNPLDQLGLYLDAADAARRSLRANPQNTLARSDYNFAVARIVELIDEHGLTPWDKPVVCPASGGGTWSFTLRPPFKNPEYHPSNFRIHPTDRLTLRGRLVGERITPTGFGAPTIVIGSDLDYTRIDPFAKGKEIFYGLTAAIRFDGRQCEMVLLDPLEHESFTLDGTAHPVAADFQAPLAIALAELNPKRLERKGLFRPQEFLRNARLARLQPYNPSKIPVLFIHGLGNSPATWAPVVAFLQSDPVIRKHFQFWFFSYPSGLPYPLAAAILRHQLDGIRKRHPGHKDVVVIGHSMGGMISRLLITDSGQKIWDTFFDKPAEAIPFTPEARDLMTRSLIFRARQDVSRVIFVSASHRGSDMAVDFLGRLGSRIVGNPIAENIFDRRIYGFIRPEARAGNRYRLPNSIELLDPQNRFLTTVDQLPLKASIPFHSLIGDRGRGGSLDHTPPVSSDGIVPYWSSHLEGARSERIIPSGHWSHLHPLGMTEIKRILLEHIGQH
jgi:pimeloyl-ACP methyl ester carboxylesterase